jgi:maleate cis-trans isomerase
MLFSLERGYFCLYKVIFACGMFFTCTKRRKMNFIGALERDFVVPILYSKSTSTTIANLLRIKVGQQ